MNDLIMHINYGEIKGNHYGKNTIESISKMAAKLGYDGIEFRGAPPVELEHMDYNEYIEEIGRCKKLTGLKNIIVAQSLAKAIEAEGDEVSKEIDKVVEKAKKANEVCGTVFFNTSAKLIRSKIPGAPLDEYQYHGSYAANEEDWKKTVDVYQKLGAKLTPLGLKFAFETHMNYIHDIPVSAKKLVDLIDSPSIGINMDFGNTVYFPDFPDLEETIDLYADKLFYTRQPRILCKVFTKPPR
ncbi:MAG: sugar phosphate isomerase/epimerase [Ruminococcaceae bacterium]|nr:sugar phosphate isomerase/epimerase [Oscillospiraceae bacterium]